MNYYKAGEILTGKIPGKNHYLILRLEVSRDGSERYRSMHLESGDIVQVSLAMAHDFLRPVDEKD